MQNILILCTGNSCRSQMMHGYLKTFLANQAHIYSAGVEVHGLNPFAVGIMAEDGIDISDHTSNHVDEYATIKFALVLTVCDHAREVCPIYTSEVQRMHCNFTDPSKASGTAKEIIRAFRTTRNSIKTYASNLADTLNAFEQGTTE